MNIGNVAGRTLGFLALVALVGSVAYGANVGGVRDDALGQAVPEARVPVVTSTQSEHDDHAAMMATRERSYPWWQTVTTARGDGPETLPPFTIVDDAIQWRVMAECAGDVVIREATETPLIDATCQDPEPGYSTRPGTHELEVDIAGEWTVEVQQQTDRPRFEPPLAEQGAPVAEGTFRDIDQAGRGSVTIRALAGGGHVLRLDDFFVTPNVDLEVRLSTLPSPLRTASVLEADSIVVAELDATAGSFNVVLPDDVDPADWGSVVIWCPPVLSAYAAAPLTSP